MTENVNIKEIEKKIYTLYHEDGIIDIFAGAWIVMFGILAILTDRVWVAGMFPVYGLALFVAIKKKITVPRIGYMKFNRQQKSKIEKVFFSIHAIIYSFAILLYTHNTPSWIDTLFQDYPMLFFWCYCDTFLHRSCLDAGCSPILCVCIADPSNVCRRAHD